MLLKSNGIIQKIIKKKKLNYQYINKQQGQSLLEFMIAGAICLILLSGGYLLLQKSQKRIIRQEILLNSHYNFLFAQEQLKNALLSAKVSFCGAVSNHVFVKNLIVNDDRINLDHPVSIFSSNASDINKWNLKKSGSGKLLNSDVLVVRSLSKDKFVLGFKLAKGANSILLPKSMRIKRSDILVFDDCEHLVFIKVAAVHKMSNQMSRIDLVGQMPVEFKKSAWVNKFLFHVYYVGQTSRYDQHHQPILALYVKDFKGSRHELIPNIINLQLKAGVDKNNDGIIDAYDAPGLIKSSYKLRNIQTTLMIKDLDKSSEFVAWNKIG